MLGIAHSDLRQLFGHENGHNAHFQNPGDTQRMWQGIQALSNYRKTSPSCDSDDSLPDNEYAWFEAQNNVAAGKTTPSPSDQVLCLSTVDVRKTVQT